MKINWFYCLQKFENEGMKIEIEIRKGKLDPLP
jgi:hypothetical protein